MNVLILAAGYATRLYPLTLTKAKPLLEVAGKPMIEWVMDNLGPVDGIETVYVVTNNKFASAFEQWAAQYQKRNPKRKLKVVNDGSMDDSDKLGAIGDINLVLVRENLAEDDLLVVAGDNLFSEPLTEFVAQAQGSEATLATYDVGDLEAMKKYSAISLDADGAITAFEEKPANPKTTLTGIALYYFSRETVSAVHHVSRRGQQSRSARALHPMALHPEAGSDPSNSRDLVRHRQQRDARRSERTLPQVRLDFPAFVEFDQVEVGADILAVSATSFFQEMEEARLLLRVIRLAGDHGLIPIFDLFVAVWRGVILDPIKDGIVGFQAAGRLFEGIGIELEESEQMLVEADGFVVVAVEQTLAMKFRLVDQTG